MPVIAMNTQDLSPDNVAAESRIVNEIDVKLAVGSSKPLPGVGLRP